MLAILGAFLGAVGAKAMFSSVPAGVFWTILVALLLVSLALAKWKRGGALLAVAHLGGLLVLLGGLAGSDSAHATAGSMLGIRKSPGGYLLLSRGERSNRLLDARLSDPVGELPFAVRLNRVRVEYYPAESQRWRLEVRWGESAGQPAPPQAIDWEVGREVSIGGCDATLTVLEYLPHARVVPPADVEADANSPTPAMRVELARGRDRKQVWLTPTEDDPRAAVSVTETLALSGDVGLHLLPPPRAVKDYASEVELLDGGKVVGGGTIRVNKPLHAGGYHFYQSACDEDCGGLTVLLVVSDRGLIPTAGGAVLLLAGVFGACWVRPVWAWWSSRRSHGRQD